MKKFLSGLFLVVVTLAFATVASADYWVTSTCAGKAQVRSGQDVVWSSGDTKYVSEEVIGYYNDNSSCFTVTEVTATGAEVNLVDGATSDTPTASTVVVRDGNGDIRTASNVGTAGTGVTAREFGDGHRHKTMLTVAVTDAITVTDNSAICDGYLVYTFPAGEIIIYGASMSMAGTLAEDTTATPEMCIGNVIGSDTQATCGADDAGLENVLGPATADDMNGTAEVLTVAVGGGTPLVLAAADPHILHFNVCATWADTAGTDLTGDLAGTIYLDWAFMQ